ncbi:hypothetical protein Lfu02_54950 [Longispora fulva]|uniref:Tail terminator n=1 Tax=Longispora fulva TaxID=619741 RepID=A0A8J7GBP1_9ACTN|nr:hypothetical protein [Longispora fulva]MBG6137523.1 hypothetical protein [Longispora fulva]GIG61123.1 hypothetical protein Lfu02_54950 [Longispora fulva]
MSYVIFGDAQAAVISYVKAEMPGTLAGSRLPVDYSPAKHGPFTRLTREGGTPQFPVQDLALIGIEVYAPTSEAGIDRLNTVLALLVAARRRNKVPGVIFGSTAVYGGPMYLEDPDTHTPRWTASIQISVRWTV